MGFGSTIQIFLPDGNPRSIKLAEITSRTLQAILIPRAKLEDAAKRKELQRCSVYFLIGAAEDESKPLVYVGEAEEALRRIRQHNQKKDFWTTAVAIVSRTQHLTKTHIKYLEWLCYQEAKSAGRYALENQQIPAKPYVSEPMEADLHDNFETLKLLVSTLGHPFFDKIPKPKKRNIIQCSNKKAHATGQYTEDGITIFEGSTVRLELASSASNYVRNTRQLLIDNKILQEVDSVYRFMSDHTFQTPSGAAAVVLGREVNGWTEWKYEDGRTLDEVHRQTNDS